MINFSQEKSFNICEYILSLVRYTLFSDEKQSNECEILQTEGGFLFVPIYPVSYVIDESFYNRLFDIMNLGLTPMYTCVRPGGHASRSTAKCKQSIIHSRPSGKTSTVKGYRSTTGAVRNADGQSPHYGYNIVELRQIATRNHHGCQWQRKIIFSKISLWGMLHGR